MCWILLLNYSYLHFRKCIYSIHFSSKVAVLASNLCLYINATQPYFSDCAPGGVQVH